MSAYKTALATSIVLSIGLPNTKKNFDDIIDRIDEFNILNSSDIDYLSLESLFNFYVVTFNLDRFESFYQKYLKIEKDKERYEQEKEQNFEQQLERIKIKHPILTHLNIFNING